MEGEAWTMELNEWRRVALFVLLLHQHNEAAIVEAGFATWSVKLCSYGIEWRRAHWFFVSCFFNQDMKLLLFEAGFAATECEARAVESNREGPTILFFLLLHQDVKPKWMSMYLFSE
jgi:hypothetical protein